MIDPRQTLADLVHQHTGCAQVLARHRIDFCCRGHLTLAEAAASRGLPFELLADELQQAIVERDAAGDGATLSTRELVSALVTGHHATIRSTLPFLVKLAVKVARVHGDRRPALRELAVVVQEFFETMLAHCGDEERNLFPLLTSDDPDRERVQEALEAMHQEHAALERLLARVRRAADEFQLPGWACTSHRTLLQELQSLEQDSLAHFHLEERLLRAPEELSLPSTAAAS